MEAMRILVLPDQSSGEGAKLTTPNVVRSAGRWRTSVSEHRGALTVFRTCSVVTVLAPEGIDA